MNTMRSTYKIILSYKGTSYRGWQFQTEKSPTVQEIFEKVISQAINYQDFSLIAASRTDKGVHANHQVIKLSIPKDTLPQLLKKGLNDKLPNDIRILQCDYIDKNFNPNQDVRSKTYHYYFTSQYDLSASLSEIIYVHSEHLDINLIKEAAQLFIGNHDFSNFSLPSSDGGSSKRTVLDCQLKETSFGPDSTNIYYIEIKSKGFLKYMVRYIMDALFLVGQKKLTINELSHYLENPKNSTKISKKAPAHGLHLFYISYN